MISLKECIAPVCPMFPAGAPLPDEIEPIRFEHLTETDAREFSLMQECTVTGVRWVIIDIITDSYARGIWRSTYTLRGIPMVNAPPG